MSDGVLTPDDPVVKLYQLVAARRAFEGKPPNDVWNRLVRIWSDYPQGEMRQFLVWGMRRVADVLHVRAHDVLAMSIAEFVEHLERAVNTTIVPEFLFELRPPATNDHPASKPDAAAPKRRGRKKADYETIQREAEIAKAWARARDHGVYKADFARGHGMTMRQLDALLDRVSKRNRHSE